MRWYWLFSSISIALAACAHPQRICEIVPQPPYVIMPDTAPQGVLRGVIAALPDSAPVHLAEVFVEGTSLTAWTDSLGRYRLAGLPADTLTVIVQGWNLRPARIRVAIPPDHGLRLWVPLVPECLQIHIVPAGPPPNKRLKLAGAHK